MRLMGELRVVAVCKISLRKRKAMSKHSHFQRDNECK